MWVLAEKKGFNISQIPQTFAFSLTLSKYVYIYYIIYENTCVCVCIQMKFKININCVHAEVKTCLVHAVVNEKCALHKVYLTGIKVSLKWAQKIVLGHNF